MPCAAVMLGATGDQVAMASILRFENPAQLQDCLLRFDAWRRQDQRFGIAEAVDDAMGSLDQFRHVRWSRGNQLHGGYVPGSSASSQMRRGFISFSRRTVL